MAAIASPYGLQPANLLGGQAYSGGIIREVPMTVNSAVAVFTGDVVLLSVASVGQPTPAAATVTTSSAGVLGVCVGVSFVDPVLKQVQHSQYLPANAITSGYTNVIIKVNDDPDQLYRVQAAGSVAATQRGRFAALENFGGSTVTGNSTIRLSTPANTGTLAVRIVDFASTPGDAFTDCIVKFNQGVHMYYNATALTT